MGFIWPTVGLLIMAGKNLAQTTFMIRGRVAQGRLSAHHAIAHLRPDSVDRVILAMECLSPSVEP